MSECIHELDEEKLKLHGVGLEVLEDEIHLVLANCERLHELIFRFFGQS